MAGSERHLCRCMQIKRRPLIAMGLSVSRVPMDEERGSSAL